MRQEWVGKRKSVRQSCLVRAEIRFPGDRPSLDCTITDVSSNGARIEGNLQDVPDSFDLFIPARNELKLARVVRREPTVLGVSFLTAREDPTLIADLITRLVALENAADGKNSARIATLEDRILRLEADLASLRRPVETAALEAPAPDRMSEVQALRESLTALADRLERTAAVPTPASEPDSRVSDLAADVEDLRRSVAALEAAVTAATRPDPIIVPAVIPDALAEEVSSLRQSVQSLILLVSQLIARSRPAA